MSEGIMRTLRYLGSSHSSRLCLLPLRLHCGLYISYKMDVLLKNYANLVCEIYRTILLAGFTLGKWYTAATFTEWGLFPPFMFIYNGYKAYKTACAYTYTFYMLSYFFDLRPMAITKDHAELLRALNAKRNRTPLFGSPQMAETPTSER